jgi:aldehyde:ferredoxin oxidoreductase
VAFGISEWYHNIGGWILSLGFALLFSTLPKPFTREPLKKGASKGQVVPVDLMVKEYYEVKGWD